MTNCVLPIGYCIRKAPVTSPSILVLTGKPASLQLESETAKYKRYRLREKTVYGGI
jgi:hypothetical protein